MRLPEALAQVQEAADARQIKTQIVETGQVFPSAAQVASYLGISHSVVYNALRGYENKQKAFEGKHFVYALDSQAITDIFPRHFGSLAETRELIKESGAWVHMPYSKMRRDDFQQSMLVTLLLQDAVTAKDELLIKRFSRGLSFLWRRSATEG